MNLSLRANLIALTASIATSIAIFVLAGELPPPLLRWYFAASAVVLLGFWVFWLVRLQRVRTATAADAPLEDRLEQKVERLGSFHMIFAGLPMMAYLDEAMQLVVTMVYLGRLTMTVLRTANQRSAPERFDPVPLILPLGLFVLYATTGGRLAIPMCVIMLAYVGTLIFLGRRNRETADSIESARLADKLARKRAEDERDARARFLASASHDLGQPLQSARLFFDQVLHEKDAGRRDQAIAETKAAFAMLARQMNNIVHHLQLETGLVLANLREHSAGLLISETASLAEAAASIAGIEINAVASRLRFTGDRELVERVLSNLADNAIRHSKASRLLIGARRHGSAIRFLVIDDGIGIPEGDLPHLFDDFVQGSNHGDEVRGGFGLGLASVRRMAALMGGTAGIDTSLKHGAAFYLELPCAPDCVSA